MMAGPKLQLISEAVHDRGPRLHLARDLLNGMLLLGIQTDHSGDLGVVIKIPEELFDTGAFDMEQQKVKLLDAIRDDVTRQLAIMALEHKESPTWPKR
jgi:hypothetical protein